MFSVVLGAMKQGATLCQRYSTANCALFVAGNLCYTEVLGKLFQLSTTRATYT